MKLRNIKAHSNLDKQIDINVIRKIFKECYATFTIHFHNKNIVHVTRIKSNTHLKLCIQDLIIGLPNTCLCNLTSPFPTSHNQDLL